MEKIITNSADETQLLGEKIGKKRQTGGVFALYGDLGSGKTTFVQGFAKGLGVTGKILSPTFIILRTYQLQKKNPQQFFHIDLYRTEGKHDIEGLGILDLMQQPENIMAIEWPEKMSDLLPEKRTDIFFEYVDEDLRKITIKEIG